MPAAAPQQASAQTAAQVAQFFRDLRTYLELGHHEIAAHLMTSADVIIALETADVRKLPPWPETSRLVLAYTAWAHVDGRAVLEAIAILAQPLAPNQVRRAPVGRLPPQFHPSVARFRTAGQALANGAMQLPQKAMTEARARPARTFYALSLPLALMLLTLNTSIVQGAFGQLTKPITGLASTIRDVFAVQFAPVREGLRWIEVEDPRTRRDDKLAEVKR